MAGNRYPGVIKRGRGWQLSFVLGDGKLRREIVHFPQSRKGEEEAHRKLTSIKSALERGDFDYAHYFPRSKFALRYSPVPGKHLTIKDALNNYLDRAESELEYSSFKDYCHRAHRHLIPAFGDLKMTELTVEYLRNWRSAKSSEGLSNKTINNVLIPLRRTFDYAFLDGLIEKDPLRRLRNLKVTPKEPKPFNLGETQAILDQLEFTAVEVKNYFQFAFETGLRTSELIGLDWNDVDLTGQKVFITRAKVRGRIKAPKTGSGRRATQLTPNAISALESQMRIRPPEFEVFRDPRTGQPWKNDQPIRKIYWYPVLEILGIPKRNPYQTRHTFASRALSRGDNYLYVANQMGHKDWGMVRQVYGKYIKD